MPSRFENADRETAPPVFKAKVGRVHLAVFEQKTSNGPMLNVTLKRSYKTDDGFKDSYSFALGDLDDAARGFAEIKAWAKARETKN